MAEKKTTFLRLLSTHDEGFEFGRISVWGGGGDS